MNTLVSMRFGSHLYGTEVVHVIPCPGETPGTESMQRVIRGVLGHIGKIDCRLSRGGQEEVDDRLDLDRYFVREADGREG